MARSFRGRGMLCASQMLKQGLLFPQRSSTAKAVQRAIAKAPRRVIAYQKMVFICIGMKLFFGSMFLSIARSSDSANKKFQTALKTLSATSYNACRAL
jgi:hypothetical protein